ncbi:hypothetical protein HYX08_03335 [Candidatus Woesearchaeota archaeon]|nr:hypothetical protein [Candidatus Woesearchaeota archaeon]
MAGILLIGTAHHDPNTYGRLEKELAEFNPDFVILEGPREKYETDLFAFHLVQKMMQKRRFPLDIIAAAKTHFKLEYAISLASTEHCNETGAKLQHFSDRYPIDTKTDVMKSVQILVDVFAADFEVARSYFAEEPGRKIASLKNLWDRVKYLVENDMEEQHSLETSSYYDLHNIGERDAQMERVLRREIKKHPTAKIAGINGLSHLMRDERRMSLYSRVIDLNPKRVFLYQ